MFFESTILIANYHRNAQLRWNLRGFARQKPKNAQFVILDDAPQSDFVCKKLIEEFNHQLTIQYIHTGINKKKDQWRVPGFAFNIGAKRTDSEFLFLCCAETHHHNDTLEPMLAALRQHKTGVMVIPQGKTDANGAITGLLNRDGSISDEAFEAIKARLLVNYPFFMGLARKDFFDIGGYDEDFVGVGVDDKDLVERLKWNGCKYIQVPAKIVHLHHSRARKGRGLVNGITDPLQYNRKLFQSKKGQIIRNQNREWGTL